MAIYKSSKIHIESETKLYVRDELLLDKVAILSQTDDAHFSYLAEQFAKQFIAVEGWITDTIDLTNQATDYTEILTSVRDRGASLLYLPVGVEHIFQIVEALEKLNWQPKIMLSDGLMSRVMVQKDQPLSLVDGMLATDTFHSDMDLTQFGERLKDQLIAMGFSQQDVVTHTLLGMEGYALLITAINRCVNSSDRQCINDRIRSTAKFEGIMGYISIDAQGKSHRPLIINELKDGKMNFRVKVY